MYRMMDTKRSTNKFRKYFVLIILACVIICMIYINKENQDVDIEADTETNFWQSSLLLNNLSCIYDDRADALPATENFSPSEKSIYFHETSCRNGLNSREACAVEAAARTNPNWKIYVLFSSKVTADMFNTGSLTALRAFNNIKLMRFHMNSLNTYKPLADRIINQSIYPVEHLSHLLRFVTLGTWGGIYLDFDVIVVRSFDSLPKNWVARETKDRIGSAVLAFSRDDVGRNFSKAILKEMNSTFVPIDWGYMGSKAITTVFRNKCSPRKPVDWSARTCQDFNVFEPTLFYPVHYFQSKAYLRKGNLRAVGVYTHHIWNQRTKGELLHKKSPYVKLARRFCPTIYKSYGETFGADGV